MKHRPYKWQIVPVVQKVEEENATDRNTDVVGEVHVTQQGQPLEVFGGVPGLIGWAQRFEADVLAKLEVTE